MTDRMSNKNPRRLLVLSALILAMTVIVATTEVPSYATDPVFSPPPPGFRIGMEIELWPEAFAGLTRYFDYDQLQAKGERIARELPSDFLDDYLRDYPQALSELPDDLRKKLTQGLQLENVTPQKDQSLVNADGKKLDSQPKLILPKADLPASQSLILIPNAPPAAAPSHQALAGAEKSKELVLPKRMAWQTLYERWRALDLSVKKSIVRWEHLSPTKKAILAIDYAQAEISTKPDLPPEEKRLFERLHWSQDGSAIEFRHREDVHVTDPNEFYHDVRQLAQRAGIENKILHPEMSKNKAAGLQFHVSVEGEDLEERGKALNRLAMVRRVSVGDLADLKGEGRYLYNPDASNKGHVRIHGKDRLESRSHFWPLHEELEFFMKILKLNSDEALELIGSEIKKLMSDYVVDKIAEYRSEYLADLMQYLTPEQLRRVQPKLDQHPYLERASQSLPEDFWHRAPALITSKDRTIRRTAIRLVFQQPSLSKEVWDRIPELMTSEDSWVCKSVVRALLRYPDWSIEVWNQIPAMMKNENPSIPQELEGALTRQQDWPKEFWRQIPALLKSENAWAREQIITALKWRSTWLKEFWDQVPAWMTSNGKLEQISILEALAGKLPWPKEVWAQVHALMKSENTHARLLMAQALGKQSVWAKEFQDHVPDLMASEDSGIRQSIEWAVQAQYQLNHDGWPDPSKSQTNQENCVVQRLSQELR
jgi:hypothetical protein